MEDVERRWVFTYLVAWFLLCGNTIAGSSVQAANQGAIGGTSIGSAAISVHIPRTVRLIVEEINQSAQITSANFCLSVIDMSLPRRPNYYHIHGLNNSPSRLVQLQNRLGASVKDWPACQREEAVFRAARPGREQANVVVLMLVPE